MSSRGGPTLTAEPKTAATDEPLFPEEDGVQGEQKAENPDEGIQCDGNEAPTLTENCLLAQSADDATMFRQG